MGDALSAGVTGLKAHQMMLDIAGNNLANVNTAAYKAGRITFSELLSETVQQASGPSASVGGRNPQQLGSGVGIASISKNLSQGSFETTGSTLDMAISGEGYFAVNNGTQNLYTRLGSFSKDADGYLVDNQSGYRVQRYGTIGEAEGFQNSGNSAIKLPYDVSLPANPTSKIDIVGNLKATSDDNDKVANTIEGSTAFTTSTGLAMSSDLITDLNEFTAGTGPDSGGFDGSATIRVEGMMPDGSTPVNSTFTIDGTSTVADVLAGISSAFGGSVNATLEDGKIVVKDVDKGYSRTEVTSISYETASAGGESLSLPSYYSLKSAGAEDSHSFSISVVDQLGGSHLLRGEFVKTDTSNMWDIVVISASGEVGDYGSTDRRIEGVQFNDDGSLSGLQNASETQNIELRFDSAPTVVQTIEFNIGAFNGRDGLTQNDSGEVSTAGAKDQDGYGTGSLSSLRVNDEGVLVGTFSNGEKKDIAALQIALFENPEGLEAAGNGYYVTTENSGEAIGTMALSGGAGSIQGQKLEKSNVDTANEFVSLMQAQNGFQANARTIKVANEVLQELTNLIR